MPLEPPLVQRCELTVMLITGPSLSTPGGKHRISLPVPSVLWVSCRIFSRHEAKLTKAFGNHHGLARGVIKMILGTAHPSLLPLTLMHLPSKSDPRGGTIKDLLPHLDCTLYPCPLKATQLSPHSCYARPCAFSGNCQSMDALSFQTGRASSIW